MLDENALAELAGKRVVDAGGEELGTVDDVYSHAAMDEAAWAVVELAGARRLVPLDGAEQEGDAIRVRYDRATIAGAPEPEGDALRAGPELYAHFGLTDADVRDDTGFPSGYENAGRPAGDPRGPHAADDAAQGHP